MGKISKIISEKKNLLSLTGFEDVVAAHLEAKRSEDEAKEKVSSAVAGVTGAVLRAVDLMASGEMGYGLADWLNWKSSRVKLLGRDGVGSVTVTLPSPGAAGNFKEIKDEGLLAAVAGKPEYESLLTRAVKGDAVPAQPEKVVLKGDLAIWFAGAYPEHMNRSDVEHVEAVEAQPAPTMLTLAPSQFEKVVTRAGSGDELAQRLLAAGFKVMGIRASDK